jgi:hypothetical protein
MKEEIKTIKEIIKLCKDKGGEWELYDLEQYLIRYLFNLENK